MAEPLIEFDGVWKKFRRGEHHDSLRDLVPSLMRRALGRGDAFEKNDYWVLRDVTFQVRSGQALGLIGPNGAGKSTSLKLLTRILKPTRGRAVVVGRAGALIEIAAGFHPDLTGRENVALQGAIMGMSQNDVRRRFDDIVAFAGLEGFIDTPVKRYSSGMNARLGFAIAAHLEPEVLLIDEVLAVGDYSFQQRCYERLRDFRAAGVPIAFVSHNMQAIATLCDRVVLLRPELPPLIGSVGSVLGEYVGANKVASDPRLRVSDVRLSQDHTGQPVTGPIAPASRLQLSLRLTSTVDLPRSGVSFQVVRSDGVMAFSGMSTLDGLPALDLQPGQTLEASIGFSANLLRGTYTVNVQLVDGLRQWPQAAIHGAASFVVEENTRGGGIAELLPAYDIRLNGTVVAQDRQRGFADALDGDGALAAQADGTPL